MFLNLTFVSFNAIFAPIFLAAFFFLYKKIRFKLYIYKAYCVLDLIFYTVIKILQNKDWFFQKYLVFGNWESKFGIEFFLNDLSLSLVLFLSFLYFIHTIVLKRQNLFSVKENNVMSFLLILRASLNGLIISNDLFNIYVFLELSCLACYGIYSCNKNAKSLQILFNYLITNLNAGLFFLLGVFFIYSFTGNLNLKEIYNFIQPKQGLSIFSNIAGLFFIIAFIMKVGIMPFHKNIYDTYRSMDISYVSLISNSVSKVYMFVLIKIAISTISLKIFYNFYYISNIFLALALFAMLLFVFISFFENKINKIFFIQIIYQSLQYIILIEFMENSIFLDMFKYSFFFNAISYFGILLIIKDVERKSHLKDYFLKDFSGVMKNKKLYRFFFLFQLMSLSGFPFSYLFFQKNLIFIEILRNNSFVIFGLMIIFNLSILFANSRIMFVVLNKNNKQIENVTESRENKGTKIILLVIVAVQLFSLLLLSN